MILSCPAKTFLLGEYLVLKGGPCLLLGTEPRFELRIRAGGGKNPFHPDSPAGKLWSMNSDRTRLWSAEFVHPSGLGGLGASGAQFLLLYSALKATDAVAAEAQLEPDLPAMLQLYGELAKQEGTQPSGADLVAQARGGVTLFDKAHGRVETMSWGFEKLGFVLIATGEKVATHEHLQTLTDWDESGLENANRQAMQAFRIKHEENFIQAVRNVRASLKALGFEAPATTIILDEITKAPSIRAAKGCGGLGADVICALIDNKDIDRMIQLLSKKYRIIATHQQLSEGLYVQSAHPPEASV